MDVEQLDDWYSRSQRRALVELLVKRVGLTRTRAEYFVRLWVYLLVKQLIERQPRKKPPLEKLELPSEALQCTHREAAELFYSDGDRGSDRAAGMMLDKLEALGLIKKHFDGNTTTIEIQPLPEIVGTVEPDPLVKLKIDAFDPGSDAIPVANLLATNYNWMNRNSNAVPYKIVKFLREWASQYSKGMRVLRREDNLNTVGFYLLYPTASSSDVNFFSSPSKSLHFSSASDVDPFQMAIPGDENCVSVFVRSWMIDTPYLAEYRIPFMEDIQQVLVELQQDFPKLCDLHTLLIHPSYEKLAHCLGFHKTSCTGPIYWMYLPLNRFLALDIKEALKNL